MKLEHLRQADIILSKCGRPQLPHGLTCVPISRGFMMNMVLDPGTSYTFTKEITGDTPWVLSSISSDQASASLVGIRCQIQLPNGRFLFGGNGVDVGQIAWIGSYRWNQDPELRCEPGSKIQVTLTDTTTTGLAQATPVNLSFDGAYLFFLKGGLQIAAPSKLASTLPRYYGLVNENIMAPVWMAGQATETPSGYVDEYFIYNSPNPSENPAVCTWTVTAGVVSAFPNPLPFQITIDEGYEFFCRRILFDVQATATAVAIVLGRLRTGAGHALMDNQFDVARYLNGAEWPGRWLIKGRDSVFIDTQLADVTGTGTVTLQVFLEGYRRRKA